MKLATRFSRKAKPGNDPDEPGRSASTLALARVRMAQAGVWALVGLGVLLGLAALLRPAAAAPKTAPGPAPTASVGPQGFAELYVATYLSQVGGEDLGALRPFYGGDVDLHDVSPGALYVSGTVTLDTAQVSKDYWSVTVGARVLDAANGSYHQGGMRAYVVGVARAVSGFVATALPAEVPLPARAPNPQLQISQLSPPNPGLTTDALERFFAAFLAATGEVDRYVSPGTGLVAVAPAPFVQTRVVRVGLPTPAPKTGPMAVRAEVEGVDASGRIQVLQYALELVQRAGRWEVHRLLPAVPLAHPRPLGPTQTSIPEDTTTTVPPAGPAQKGTATP
ncbi:MAG: conjugal transfer protein [Actinomycetota bacterium]|nr:conjugal transfer protein [Actinomycetota bacterium]